MVHYLPRQMWQGESSGIGLSGGFMSPNAAVEKYLEVSLMIVMCAAAAVRLDAAREATRGYAWWICRVGRGGEHQISDV